MKKVSNIKVTILLATIIAGIILSCTSCASSHLTYQERNNGCPMWYAYKKG